MNLIESITSLVSHVGSRNSCLDGLSIQVRGDNLAVTMTKGSKGTIQLFSINDIQNMRDVRSTIQINVEAKLEELARTA